jgi:uncharacterized protein
MLYIVIAKDGTDPEAPQRRLAVREKHLQEVQPAVAAGIVQVGGALLNQEGIMIGSMMILEAESEEAAREFLSKDIYSKTKVWQSFEIYPFRRAV